MCGAPSATAKENGEFSAASDFKTAGGNCDTRLDVKTYTRSTKQLVNFVQKHDDIAKIYINSDAIAYDTIAELLALNKKVIILEKLTAKKALKLV